MMKAAFPKSLIEISHKDLSPYRKSNTGVDYVHTFDSGRTGPHVMINALTRGNELCSMAALCHLLDNNLQPTRGKLTLSFANVAAYETFNPDNPAASMFLDVNLNRVWSDDILDGNGSAREIARAREMRPIVREVDAVLDLLSNPVLRDPHGWVEPPLLAYPAKESARQIATAMKFPLHQIETRPSAIGDVHSGLLYEYGNFSDPSSAAVGLLAECGPHFSRRAENTALNVALRFLNACGVVEKEIPPAFGVSTGDEKIRRYTDLLTPLAATDAFQFVGDFRGYETFSKGDLVAMDGDQELRAPYDNCVLIVVASDIKKGSPIGHFIRKISD
jgi:predicted deacylase